MQEVSRLVQPVDKAELELGACAVPVAQSKNNPATSKTRRMSVSPGRVLILLGNSFSTKIGGSLHLLARMLTRLRDLIGGAP